MGSDAALLSRLLLLVSSAEEGDRLCSSDLGTAVRLSGFVRALVWLAKADKEEGVCETTGSGLGREEKGLGKLEGNLSWCLPARRKLDNQLAVLHRQVPLQLDWSS